MISDLGSALGDDVVLAGWIFRLRQLSKTTFLILQDCTGLVQCVCKPELLKELHLKLDDVVEVHGRVRADSRSAMGYEIDILELKLLNPSGQILPFNASSDLSQVGQEILLEHRPLTLRNPQVGEIFRLQAALVQHFRDFLAKRNFTEIFTSKIVASGTEGGTNLFTVKYFDRVAYLAQSPQFYKEYGVAGLERVFETGHVYRAEPHASSRHLTEYYSLDLEFAFIEGPEEVIQLERELLDYIFKRLNETFAKNLPSMLSVPCWEFGECLERLKSAHGRADLFDDLDPLAERQLCEIAEKECGVPAVFVLGFPLASRPFYTSPRQAGSAQSFDLLFRGLEITTGGQRLHRRQDLEKALLEKGMEFASFEHHLRMFELGMPPHGGFAIGAERLTAQILGLSNVRQTTMYPRDRYHIAP